MRCTKIPFDSRAEANEHARRAKASRTARQPMRTCSAYECPKCGAWHLTSLSKAEQRRRGLR